MKIGKIDLSGVSLGTWTRTIAFFIAIVNQILTSAGKAILPFESEELVQTVSAVFTIITGFLAWWKNESFTQEAQGADEVMYEAKNGTVEKEMHVD